MEFVVGIRQQTRGQVRLVNLPDFTTSAADEVQMRTPRHLVAGLVRGEYMTVQNPRLTE